MKNGQKMRGQLVKFNEEYINSRFYYSVEVDFNGSVKTIKNIKGTSFVRKNVVMGDMLETMHYMLMYIS